MMSIFLFFINAFLNPVIFVLTIVIAHKMNWVVSEGTNVNRILWGPWLLTSVALYGSWVMVLLMSHKMLWSSDPAAMFQRYFAGGLKSKSLILFLVSGIMTFFVLSLWLKGIEGNIMGFFGAPALLLSLVCWSVGSFIFYRFLYQQGLMPQSPSVANPFVHPEVMVAHVPALTSHVQNFFWTPYFFLNLVVFTFINPLMLASFFKSASLERGSGLTLVSTGLGCVLLYLFWLSLVWFTAWCVQSEKSSWVQSVTMYLSHDSWANTISMGIALFSILSIGLFLVLQKNIPAVLSEGLISIGVLVQIVAMLQAVYAILNRSGSSTN